MAMVSALLRLSPTALLITTPLLLAKTIVAVATTFAAGAFLDALVADSSPVCPFLLIVVLGVLRLAFEAITEFVLSRAARHTELILQFRLLTHILNRSPAEIEGIGNGELVAKFLRDAGAAAAFLRSFFPRALVAIATLVTAGTAAFMRSAMLGVAFLGAVPLAALVFRPYSAKFGKSARILRRNADNSIGVLFEFFHVLPYLQTLGAEKRFANTPTAALSRLKKGNRLGDALGIGFGLASATLSVCGECAVLGVAGSLAAAGRIPIGDVVAFQMLFLTSISAIQGVVTLLPEAASIREGILSLQEILQDKSQISYCQPNAIRHEIAVDFGKNPETKNNFLRIGNRMEGSGYAPPSIECRDVSFTYPGAALPAVSRLSVRIPAGSITAITGRNGAGKTTLLKLLCYALTPSEGTILINGVPLEHDMISAFRQNLGIVFQDNLLLSSTFHDNITLRDTSIGPLDIESALVASGVDAVVRRLPVGFSTPLGNGGRSLSGGEIQKVAIARALARKASLLVFDEVTNHLDASSRTAFCELLDTLRGRCTILLVTHDPEVLRRCDNTVPLELKNALI